MRASAFKYSLLSLVSSLTILIILLMPFHAFLTVWGSSLVGHYTLLRLWKEIILLVCALAAVYLLFTDKKIRDFTVSRRLVWLITGFAALNMVGGLFALQAHRVDAKAFGYGMIVDLRFLAFFLITWAVSLRLARLRLHWQWITLWPAAFVVIFGLLQALVLPHNFLAHFGYGRDTIPPIETINNNSHYIRVMSTLRGANPLGAYLILPISMLAVLMFRKKIERKQMVLLAAMLLCLLLSFSRSAWIGVLISLAIVVYYSFRSRRARRNLGIVAIGLLLLASASAVILRHNDHFENYVFHTQEESTIATTSDAGHRSALRQGMSDLWHEPLGRGPGTAGPASVYNNHDPRISENFFLQIGQETGWLGIIVIITIMSAVGYLLWVQRDGPLALSLFASLIGLTIVNMLSHAWADDTLAYIWWGLAGIAMAPNLKEQREQQDGST